MSSAVPFKHVVMMDRTKRGSSSNKLVWFMVLVVLGVGGYLVWISQTGNLTGLLERLDNMERMMVEIQSAIVREATGESRTTSQQSAQGKSALLEQPKPVQEPMLPDWPETEKLTGYTKGFVYAVVGQKEYYNEAMQSASSIKTALPQANITLFTDLAGKQYFLQKGQENPFTLVIVMSALTHFEDKRNWGGRNEKVRAFQVTPYDRTIWVDADTRACPKNMHVRYSS